MSRGSGFLCPSCKFNLHVSSQAVRQTPQHRYFVPGTRGEVSAILKEQVDLLTGHTFWSRVLGNNVILGLPFNRIVLN